MTLLLSQRRLLTLMTVPVMVFILARFLVIVGAPQARTMSFLPHWEATARVHAPVATPHKEAAPVKTVAVGHVETASLMSLKSSLRDYRYVLSGQVTCGGAPCQAELRLTIQTDHDPDFKQTIHTTADGYFDFQTVIQEYIHEPIDWRVMVYTPHTYPVELHERKILTDESTVEIHRDVNLP